MTHDYVLAVKLFGKVKSEIMKVLSKLNSASIDMSQPQLLSLFAYRALLASGSKHMLYRYVTCIYDVHLFVLVMSRSSQCSQSQHQI